MLENDSPLCYQAGDGGGGFEGTCRQNRGDTHAGQAGEGVKHTRGQKRGEDGARLKRRS